MQYSVVTADQGCSTEVVNCMFLVHAVYMAHYFLLIYAYYAKRRSWWYMILLPMDQYSVQGMFTLIFNYYALQWRCWHYDNGPYSVQGMLIIVLFTHVVEMVEL